MFFEHDLSGHLTEGEHTISIVSDSVDQRDVVYVDLVIDAPGCPVVLVSGEGWDVSSSEMHTRSSANTAVIGAN